MKSDPKEILAEFGIDAAGKDPDGQYQWKMLSLRAGSEERKRLEKAWSAYVLGRKQVDLTGAPPPTSPPPAASSWWGRRKWVVAVVLAVLAGIRYYGYAYQMAEPRPAVPPTTAKTIGDWRVKYDALKTLPNESGHKEEHHEEVILLAEAAKSAIEAGQATAMLDRMNADLVAEREDTLAKPMTALEQHTEQWKVIVQALIMNKAELLDHEAFKGHHNGEL